MGRPVTQLTKFLFKLYSAVLPSEQCCIDTSKLLTQDIKVKGFSKLKKSTHFYQHSARDSHPSIHFLPIHAFRTKVGFETSSVMCHIVTFVMAFPSLRSDHCGVAEPVLTLVLLLCCFASEIKLYASLTFL